MRKAAISSGKSNPSGKSEKAPRRPALPGSPLLRRSMPAGQALRIIHRQLQDSVRASLQQVLADPHNPDDAPLHNLRVACRRTRSSLRLLGREVLPAAATAAASATLRELASATNRCRDLDVFLLTLAQDRQRLAAVHQPGLDQLRDYLQQQRHQQGEWLRAALQAPALTAALADWDALLATPVTAADGARAQTRIVKVASRRIFRTYRGLLRRGRALTPAAGGSAFHALRIQAKKLRYLLELSASLYPPRRVSRALKHLRALQAVLGRVQDAEVQQQGLQQFATAMAQSGAAVPAAALAPLELLLAERRQQALEEVAAAIAGFDRPALRRLFRGLFGRAR